MKKLKKLLPAFIAVALAFVMVFAVACNGSCGGNGGNGGNGETTETLTSIAVDYSSAKTQYVIGEEFSSEGLVVTAKVEVDGATQDKNVPLTDSNLTVDSSAYKKDTVGQYTINVSYTLNGVTKTANYTVSVKDGLKGPGLKVSLATGVEDTIELSESEKTATIDLTKIVVEVVSATGETMDTLTADQYTAELYKDDQKLDETSGLGGGVYQIWATAKTAYAYDENWNPSNFVLVYVVNNLTTLTWDSEAAGTLTEQTASSTDSISSTWKFTAAYANGDTKDVTEDVVLSGVETKTAGENKTATATYTEANAKGEEISKTADVTYTITSSGSSEASKTYTFDFAELQAKIKERVSQIVPNTNPNNENKPYIESDTLGDKIQLDATDFAGEKNSFITFLEGSTKSDQYRTSSGGCFEIKGDRLQVTLTHAGTITIAFASTGSSNTSDFGLKKADGTFVSGTGATESTTTGMYSVTGTSFVEVTFTVEAGTYTITAGSTTNDRGARINKLVVVDGVGGGSEASKTYTFDFAELQAKIKERVSQIVPNTNPNNENKPYIESDTLGDKIQLDATDFAGEKNSFITFLEGSTKSDQYRTSSGGCFEIKGDRLQVTLTHAGTITIAFASTGSSNTSDFGLKKADGTFVSGTGATESTTTGMYSVTGTSFVEVTFTVEAGTYTITAGSTTNDRGARINKLVVVDGVN